MVSTISEYLKRKNKIHDHLGGCCVKCGNEDDLHVDHKDHMKKNFTIMTRWSIAWDILVKELELCQLLCRVCHLNKTKAEGSLTKSWTTKPQGVKHGKAWSYIRYKCRCVLCIEAKKSSYKKLDVAQSG